MVSSFLFKSGNAEHPTDQFYDAVVELATGPGAGNETFTWTNVGTFRRGTADGALSRTAPSHAIRIRATVESAFWVSLREVSSFCNAWTHLLLLLIDWLIACLTACLIDLSIAWLFDWLVFIRLSEWLIDWLIDWLIGVLVDHCSCGFRQHPHPDSAWTAIPFWVFPLPILDTFSLPICDTNKATLMLLYNESHTTLLLLAP